MIKRNFAAALVAAGMFAIASLAQATVVDLINNDHFLVTADFAAYAGKQREVDDLFRQKPVWATKAITNTAKMGWFSADRAIREYARDLAAQTQMLAQEPDQSDAGPTTDRMAPALLRSSVLRSPRRGGVRANRKR